MTGFDLERFVWGTYTPRADGNDDANWRAREVQLFELADWFKAERRFELWRLRHEQEKAA